MKSLRWSSSKTKSNIGRSDIFSSELTYDYQKYSYKSIRSTINQHLQDFGRDIDIVWGKELRSSNSIFDGKLKK